MDYKFCKYCFDNYLMKKFNNIRDSWQHYYYQDDRERIKKILLVKHIELLKDFKDKCIMDYIKEKSNIEEKNELFAFDTLIKLNDNDLIILNNNLSISKRTFNSYNEIDMYKQLNNQIMFENLKISNSLPINSKYNFIKV